jgi:superfamily I DNA/RNA helicase
LEALLGGGGDVGQKTTPNCPLAVIARSVATKQSRNLPSASIPASGLLRFARNDANQNIEDDTEVKLGATLFAVGDDDQAIYGFQGADIRTIRNFTARFKNARIVKLQINYRSITPILTCANRLWVDKPEEYRKTLVSGLKTQPSGCRKPQITRFGVWEQLLEWIIAKARSINQRESIPINAMAILFRLNETLDSAAGYFTKMGIAEDNQPQLLTVHASKGLEYPVVFLCDMEEGMFPHYRLPKETHIDTWMEFFQYILKPPKETTHSCDLEEELRLFYVAVTRAQRFLYFATAAKKPFHGWTTNFKPSRFLRLVR